MKKNIAFTLAEILITLSIIGVVAAMTLPVIHAKIQRIILNSQFKKTYSTLSNAIQKANFDMGETGCYYKDEEPAKPNKEDGCKDFFYKYLVENLKITKLCKTNSFENGCLPDYKWTADDIAATCGAFTSDNIKSHGAIILNDGSIIFIASGSKYSYPFIGFDVNGFKGPNKSGYDVYAIGMTKVNSNIFFRGPYNGADKKIGIAFCLPKNTNGIYLYDEIMK